MSLSGYLKCITYKVSYLKGYNNFLPISVNTSLTVDANESQCDILQQDEF